MVPNGLLADVAVEVTRRLDAERWAVAEERTAELIARIQPTPASENRRRAVADYVQRLIMGCLPCQVVAFGSFPLKTYLPDGDIDVTAFGNSEELKSTWAVTLRDALEHEEKSEKAEFRVREVQYIQAEVKIIKCLVENIAVDISFNQVGGLCTLCFLEEMDHLINQNHLFKRSIILIKVWCYYESRILGAHHGLISTYALETLVLYIFHVFNNSFAGPLEVLYRFLEFFSNFDWEKFCVSLWGPVPISSLPEMAADPPRKDGGALLLSKSFLDICSSIYAVMPSPHDNQVHPFVSKYFNIIDPLRANNNLGRSVSKGNFFRIRSAFAFGAKRLAKLLECPKEDLAIEVKQFFTNTWRRHGNGYRPDAPAQSLIHQTVKVLSVQVPSSHRNTTAHKKKFEVPTTHIGHDSFTEDSQNMALQNFGSLDDAHLPDANITTPPVSVVADHDNKSDILNSDFLSHWQNLQYGRFCQNARPPAPVLYPAAVPPMYLPGHFPLNGPATQPAHIFNWAQVRSRGQGVVPLTPLHTSESASGFQRHGEDAPRYRGGTGTYLPTPKVPFKDRQSGSRSYRGSYNSERVDHNDKEGSWVNSKQRNTGRSQSEQSGVRHDTQTSDENESERHWQPYRSDSHRREAGGPSSVQSHSFENTDSTHDDINMAYGVPSQPSNVSSGTSDSSQQVVMVYSYDQSVDYSAPSKPIEFGSFGATPMDSSEIKQAHEVHENGFYKQRHAPYKSTSSRLSPDQPSMPHLPRS